MVTDPDFPIGSLATLDSIYVHSLDVVVRELEGHLLIVPLISGIGNQDDEMYTLNETGRAIWGCLDGKRPLKEIIQELAARFEAPEGEIEADVLGLATELARRRMIVPVERA